jgi:hypothetical protein
VSAHAGNRGATWPRALRLVASALYERAEGSEETHAGMRVAT